VTPYDTYDSILITITHSSQPQGLCTFSDKVRSAVQRRSPSADCCDSHSSLTGRRRATASPLSVSFLLRAHVRQSLEPPVAQCDSLNISWSRGSAKGYVRMLHTNRARVLTTILQAESSSALLSLCLYFVSGLRLLHRFQSC
jgi:hypothetical protein